ncbi:hypothetical protein [Marilutibacter chinensis]|uniref:Aldose 1-epimerase n=1 Tax=Marilutibacter chinensis TaxID=2912247 RepID=A0ABS9HRL0_9GAMM|nr:hypothetical protein [Lysobacter chinensis]MCF7221303.1 hypothetical protein [Lysobacter chinensis]
MVVWNPGEVAVRRLDDLARHFVCVEAGYILEPLEHDPTGNWRGRQRLSLAAT